MGIATSLNARERLRQAIDEQQGRLRAEAPPDRQAAILALLRAQDDRPESRAVDPSPNLIAGRRLANPGWNKALQLCLEATEEHATAAPAVSSNQWVRWAERFLAKCGRLAEAELVLAHTDTGFMRLVDDGGGRFDAWIATSRSPTSWRERADFEWWASWLGKQYEPELQALEASRPHGVRREAGDIGYYRQLAHVRLQTMDYQLGYPSEAVIGGCSIQTYRDVLRLLTAWALQSLDRSEAIAPREEGELVAEIASALAGDPAIIAQAVSAFTLHRENAAYHAAVPGVAAAPLVRIAPSKLIWSMYGLTSEPLLFLTRELRRSDAQEYHNSAFLREAVFRQDLLALFADKRFVTSAGRIALRRADGDVRTDIDAAIFDRKTGTLGLFELKSQDPFARSTVELARQRDNVLYANRQISGVLDWLKRYGANEILNRVDNRTAKSFRVHKVYPFVLGRYLVHFSDGPEPDRRAAWGTWPQVLRIFDGRPFGAADANPLASLFTRLTKDIPFLEMPIKSRPREIDIGAARLTVYPSFAALQAREGTR